MPISLLSEITIPSKVLDKAWLASLQVSAPIPLGEASASITLIPYNSDGEKSLENAINISLEGIMAEVAANPEGNLAKAMYFILEVAKEKYLASQQGV